MKFKKILKELKQEIHNNYPEHIRELPFDTDKRDKARILIKISSEIEEIESLVKELKELE
jgi:hypothetical protein